jgi:hypothetical protein
MPSVEERLAYLEGRVGDQTTVLADLRGDIRGLRTEISGFRGETKQECASFRGEVNQELASLRGDMDRRFTAIDARLAAADAKFTWLIGIQVGMLLMVASAALGFLFK